MGSALASGAAVFLVSQNWWSIEHHPRCRKFNNFEDAITAIMAMVRARRPVCGIAARHLTASAAT
jgi:hypothetical protein